MLIGLEPPDVVRHPGLIYDGRGLAGYGAVSPPARHRRPADLYLRRRSCARIASRRRASRAKPSWQEVTWTAMRVGRQWSSPWRRPLTTADGRTISRPSGVPTTSSPSRSSSTRWGVSGAHAQGAAPAAPAPGWWRAGCSKEAHARNVAAEAGLRRLDEEGRRDGVDPEVSGSLRKKYAARVDLWLLNYVGMPTGPRTRTTGPWWTGTAAAPSARNRLHRRLRTAMIDAERRAIIDLRDRERDWRRGPQAGPARSGPGDDAPGIGRGRRAGVSLRHVVISADAGRVAQVTARATVVHQLARQTYLTSRVHPAAAFSWSPFPGPFRPGESRGRPNLTQSRISVHGR